jgi:hypothetical protein
LAAIVLPRPVPADAVEPQALIRADTPIRASPASGGRFLVMRSPTGRDGVDIKAEPSEQQRAKAAGVG